MNNHTSSIRRIPHPDRGSPTTGASAQSSDCHPSCQGGRMAFRAPGDLVVSHHVALVVVSQIFGQLTATVLAMTEAVKAQNAEARELRGRLGRVR